MDKSIGLKIRKVREIKNFNQSYVADKLSVSQSAYSDLENGKIRVTEKKLQEIANVLEVTPEIIEGFSDALIFNSCSQSGQYNTYNIKEIQKEELYCEVIFQLKERIKNLEEIVLLKDKLLKDK